MYFKEQHVRLSVLLKQSQTLRLSRSMLCYYFTGFFKTNRDSCLEDIFVFPKGSTHNHLVMVFPSTLWNEVYLKSIKYHSDVTLCNGLYADGFSRDLRFGILFLMVACQVGILPGPTFFFFFFLTYEPFLSECKDVLV